MTPNTSQADRERLAVLVAETPGLTTNELAEAIGVRRRIALADLRKLERVGRVERWHDGHETRWFPPW